jgi:8-oxo-dGTP pyrophosphatase MutT (NUDIX family)
MLQAVTVMLFEDDRLLLAQDGDSRLWMTVGGAIDPDEAPADAAVREFWEETGLIVDVTGLLGVFGGPEFRVTYSNGDTASYVVTAFEARRIGGRPRPDGVEAVALRFVSRDEAVALPMAAWTKTMVARAFERVGMPYFARPTWRPPSGG